MRPLTRTTVPTERLESRPAYALLMSVFGPYCSISEEPLYDIAHVWDKAANSEFPPNRAPGENWNNLLLLSPTTCEAWRRHHDQPSSELTIPDEEVSFHFADSPLIYSLEDVNIVLTDENDEKVQTSGTEKLVIVTGTTKEARATIETFSLNTEYFNRETNEFRLPFTEYLCRQDVVVRSRTHAWRRATATADAIAPLSKTECRSLIAQLQMSAAATGHWSVWVTVLWNRLKDLGFLSAVLGGRSDVGSDADLIGFGPHNEFPGTASGWQLPTSIAA